MANDKLQAEVRCGSTMWRRYFEGDDKLSAWIPEEFPSISKAKKANGLNGRTIESPKLLPNWLTQQPA